MFTFIRFVPREAKDCTVLFLQHFYETFLSSDNFLAHVNLIQ